MLKLDSEQIKNVSSKYLDIRSAFEKWCIKEFIIDEKDCIVKIDMLEYLTSDTDEDKYHLTIFSALEFTSQIMNIYMHHYFNLNKKTSESWMIDSQISIKKTIRNHKNINVSMIVNKIRKIKNQILCEADFIIKDSKDGLMKIKLKGFIS